MEPGHEGGGAEVTIAAMPRWRALPWQLRYRYGARLASELRRLAVVATHRHCRVELAGPAWLGPGFALHIPEHGSFVVGPGVEFRRGFVCEISGEGRVTIGAGSAFTSHALIQCSTQIDIGERCVFGQSTVIADGFHRFRDPHRHLLDQGYDFRPVVIGDGAVATSKCTITASVGERALLAAHSVVTRPVPAYSLAGGAPARVIDYFGPPELRPVDTPASKP